MGVKIPPASPIWIWHTLQTQAGTQEVLGRTHPLASQARVLSAPGEAKVDNLGMR